MAEKNPFRSLGSRPFQQDYPFFKGPKTHSLLYFAGELPLNLPDDGQSLLEELEGMGIEARYPPDLDATLKRLPHDTVEITIARSKKVFSWIKQELTR